MTLQIISDIFPAKWSRQIFPPLWLWLRKFYYQRLGSATQMLLRFYKSVFVKTFLKHENVSQRSALCDRCIKELILSIISAALVITFGGCSSMALEILSTDKQRVLMHGHQGWNVRHGLCHIYMIYVYIWVVHSFCLFCCLFIIVTTQFVALYEPCKPKPKPKPSTYDTRTTTPWQRSKFRYLDRSQSNKYAINMQIQTISVSK